MGNLLLFIISIIGPLLALALSPWVGGFAALFFLLLWSADETRVGGCMFGGNIGTVFMSLMILMNALYVLIKSILLLIYY